MCNENFDRMEVILTLDACKPVVGDEEEEEKTKNL